MEKCVVVHRNPNGDSRTAPKTVEFNDFQQANDLHIQEVMDVMKVLSVMINERGGKHDYTKKTEEELFWHDFRETLDNPSKEKDFCNMPWYKQHITRERHHLTSRCPADVNLVDVLEMITDNVVAGLARSGEVRPIEITDDILKKAFNNTVKMIQDMIEVV